MFFRNPLIKWLWPKVFFELRPNDALMYFRRVRSYPQEGEERFTTLVKDMRLCEVNYNIRLLPPNTQNCKNITLLTRKELEQDVATLWKYNKRNQIIMTEWLK